MLAVVQFKIFCLPHFYLNMKRLKYTKLCSKNYIVRCFLRLIFSKCYLYKQITRKKSQMFIVVSGKTEREEPTPKT